MASRKIIIAGVTYVRSRDAARLVDLAPDYISSLARARVIRGQLVNNVWFVNLGSLRTFTADQWRQKQQWRARLAEMRREEQRLAGHPSALLA